MVYRPTRRGHGPGLSGCDVADLRHGVSAARRPDRGAGRRSPAEPGGGRPVACAVPPRRPVLVAVPALPRWRPAWRPRPRLLRAAREYRSGAGISSHLHVGVGGAHRGGGVRHRIRGGCRAAPGRDFRWWRTDRQPGHHRGADLRAGLLGAIRVRSAAGPGRCDGRRPADLRQAAAPRNRFGRGVIRLRGAADCGPRSPTTHMPTMCEPRPRKDCRGSAWSSCTSCAIR